MTKIAHPGRLTNTDTYDGAVSELLKLNNSELLLFYRQSDTDHVAADGRVVMRRSTNLGNTWGEPTTVHNVPNRDTGEPSLVYDERSERIVLFDQAMKINETSDPPAIEGSEAYRMESTDNGHSWNEPTRITDELIIDNPWPFGGYIETSNGLMTQFFSGSYEIEVMFSADGGQTWGKNRLAHTPDDRQGLLNAEERERALAEPVPCAITKNRILLFGRDGATGDFYAIKSTDGGTTWDDPIFFNPKEGTTPCPIWVRKTNPNQITALWGDRDARYIVACTMSAQLAWQEPRLLEDRPKKRIHRQVGDSETASYWNGIAGDFGYPTLVQWGSSPHEMLVVFYDEGPQTNLWRMTLY